MPDWSSIFNSQWFIGSVAWTIVMTLLGRGWARLAGMSFGFNGREVGFWVLALLTSFALVALSSYLEGARPQERAQLHIVNSTAFAVPDQQAVVNIALINQGRGRGAVGLQHFDRFAFFPLPTDGDSENARRFIEESTFGELRREAERSSPNNRAETAPGSVTFFSILGPKLTKTDFVKTFEAAPRIRRPGHILLAASLMRYRDGDKFRTIEWCHWVDGAAVLLQCVSWGGHED
jgi:hypothetical protein